MLAYRHSFHAGNHADVLKHIVLMAVVQYFNQKDKPYWVVDTHSGAGVYALDKGYALVKQEFAQGIARLFDQSGVTAATTLPALLTDYLALVKSFSPDLKLYPGSPAISAKLIRPIDKLRLFELHPTDAPKLAELFRHDRRCVVQHSDGFAGLKALLPPASRRAVVLIDPSYEIKDDYRLVAESIKDSVQRFAQGCYMVWYPILHRPEWNRMLDRLKRSNDKWLNVSLTVSAGDDQGFGLLGSGMFVVNPPWVLQEQLNAVMPHLQRSLAHDIRPEMVLESQGL